MRLKELLNGKAFYYDLILKKLVKPVSEIKSLVTADLEKNFVGAVEKIKKLQTNSVYVFSELTDLFASIHRKDAIVAPHTVINEEYL